jgi:hypothetical protein
MKSQEDSVIVAAICFAGIAVIVMGACIYHLVEVWI